MLPLLLVLAWFCYSNQTHFDPVDTDPITGGIRMAPIADPQPRLHLDGEPDQ